MINTLIFDLDGTLVNSINDLANAVNQSLEKRGFQPHSLEKFYQFVGDGIVMLIKRALPDEAKTEENLKNVLDDFRQYYREHLLDCTAPYEGIRELLQNIIELNKNKSETEKYKIAIASNKPNIAANIIVKKLFPEVFDVVYGKLDDLKCKPSPAIIKKILKELDREPESAVMIGDSNVDILTAKNAGIASIGVAWGFRGKAELIGTGADFIAESPAEILEFVKKSIN